MKDLLGVLRWVTNHKDQVCGFRVLHLLHGIGPKTAHRLLLQTAKGTPLLEAVARFKPAAAHWGDFFALLPRLTVTLPAGRRSSTRSDSGVSPGAGLPGLTAQEARTRAALPDRLLLPEPQAVPTDLTHPRGSRCRLTRRNRRGAPLALCGDDPHQGSTSSHDAAPVYTHGQAPLGDRQVPAARNAMTRAGIGPVSLHPDQT